ncbi:MAG TPA: hypothetical protein VJI32_02385 [Candidatus Nanoarchaeia archaeon]|nr:hypothetical protein [Candidatus Nanoarchaeia archaeon]
MKLPTFPHCQELFDKYKAPGTVKEHCKTVHKVAVFLAEELVKQGYPLNIEIVKPFSLLHDFMKAVVLERLTDPPYNYTPTPEEVNMHLKLREQYKGLSETKVAHLLLHDEFPEFAQLFLELDELTRNPHAQVSEEARFIHYVDWRVLGNKVVPLTKRLEYIYDRYGHWIQKKNIDWEAAKQEQFEYERKIFNCLGFDATQLGEKINGR